MPAQEFALFSNRFQVPVLAESSFVESASDVMSVWVSQSSLVG